jgi:hypothetical protein
LAARLGAQSPTLASLSNKKGHSQSVSGRGRHHTIAMSPSHNNSGDAVGSTWRATGALAVQMGACIILARRRQPDLANPKAGRIQSMVRCLPAVPMA